MTGADEGGSRTYSLDPGAGGASFPRLLFALLRQRFTGTVTIEQRAPAGQRCIWVRGGMPVFCDWDSPGDRLGELLVEAGAITPDTLEQGLADHLLVGEPLGQVLVEQGAIETKTLHQALRTQCSRKLVRVFALNASEGEATVTAVEHPKGTSDGTSQINVLGLLTAGVGSHYDEARVESEVGAAFEGDLVATPPFARYEQQFGFSPDDASILGAFARGVTIERLLSPNVSRKRVLQIAYVLWITQMLRSGDDATQAIAKGATAAASGQALGVMIGSQSGTSRSKPSPKPKASAPPKPKAPAPPKPNAPAPPKAELEPPPPPKAEPKPPPPPKAEPEPKVRQEDPAFESLLAELEGRIAAEANAFALFALDVDADRKGIRAVWAELSKSFHPDTLEGRGLPHLRSRVEPVFAALSEAYGVLNNKAEREKLRGALQIGGESLKAGEDANAVVRNAFEAELIARDGDKFLKAKQWAKAAELYTKAHALSPQDQDIAAAHHYANYRAGEPSPDLARIAIAQLSKIIEEQPVCARAYYFQGLLQLGIEDLAGAKTNFAKASQLDRRNIDAERQLRAIRLRERGPGGSKAKAEPKKSGFDSFRNLFKK